MFQVVKRSNKPITHKWQKVASRLKGNLSLVLFSILVYRTIRPTVAKVETQKGLDVCRSQSRPLLRVKNILHEMLKQKSFVSSVQKTSHSSQIFVLLLAKCDFFRISKHAQCGLESTRFLIKRKNLIYSDPVYFLTICYNAELILFGPFLAE